MYLDDANELEVFELLSRLDTRKSTGPDGVSNFILRKCADKLAKPLVVCVNKSFNSGSYPDFLKLAKVVPIFKGGSPLCVSNYRPISILSAVNKIYETLIAIRVKSFLRSQDILYRHQYGFREKSGTSTAVLEALDFVYSSLDRRDCGVVSALMIDLRKAFDSVDHSILLRNLHLVGVRGLVHDLMASYLLGREQFVTVRKNQSSRKPVIYGVPQGSVLGPLQFLIFLNDIARLPLNGKLFLYADDACLFYTGGSDSINIRRMNEDLEMLHSYLTINKLALNLSKTKYMHFHDPRRLLERELTVSLFGTAIEEVNEFCYLGVILDSHLTWKRHVEFLCKKISSVIGVLFRVRDELPLYALKLLYFGLVHSHLSYMVSLWGNAPASCLTRLQSLQNRALKLSYRLPLLTPSLDLYKSHVRDVLPIKRLHVITVCKFVRLSLSNSAYHTLTFPDQLRIGACRDPLRLARTQPFSG